MNILVSCEFRFFRDAKGQVWTPSAFQYPFWLRYLRVFENVVVIARVCDVDTAQKDWQRADGDNVTFFDLPYYVGLVGMIRTLPATIKRLRQVADISGMLLCRVPSQTAGWLSWLFRGKRNIAYEVVGDPQDVFATGVGGRLLAPLLGFFAARTLRRQCQQAFGVSYVTRTYLQSRYPAGQNSLTSYYSSIILTPEQLAPAPRNYTKPARRLLFVGAMAQLYKAPDILISAFSQLRKDHDDYHLTLIGGGKELANMQQLAAMLGVSEHIDFLGEVDGDRVMQALQHAEVFVLPSRTEGLPRAIIEAMAKGLPCVGTKVGGIPELLEDEYCVPADNVDSLYATLAKLCNDTMRLDAQSSRNLTHAAEYLSDTLENRRTAFYRSLREQ